MEKLKTIDVKGKNYVMVNERLKYFREHFEGYALISEIIEFTPERVCILAKIHDNNGVIKATGIAFEEKQSSYINKTSYIENCETSAWGRALANFGIGIDESVSSADEVARAFAIQEEQEKGAVQKKGRRTKKDTAVPVTDKLSSLKDEIITLMGGIIESGVSKDEVYAVISENNGGKKNPNSLKTEEACEKVLEQLKDKFEVNK